MRQKTRNHLSLQNSMAVELYSKSMASSFLTNKQNDPISRMSDLSVLLSQWCHFVKPTESFQILYIDSLVSFSFFRVYNTYLLSPLPLFSFYFWFAFFLFLWYVIAMCFLETTRLSDVIVGIAWWARSVPGTYHVFFFSSLRVEFPQHNRKELIVLQLSQCFRYYFSYSL